MSVQCRCILASENKNIAKFTHNMKKMPIFAKNTEIVEMGVRLLVCSYHSSVYLLVCLKQKITDNAKN